MFVRLRFPQVEMLVEILQRKIVGETQGVKAGDGREEKCRQRPAEPRKALRFRRLSHGRSQQKAVRFVMLNTERFSYVAIMRAEDNPFRDAPPNFQTRRPSPPVHVRCRSPHIDKSSQAGYSARWEKSVLHSNEIESGGDAHARRRSTNPVSSSRREPTCPHKLADYLLRHPLPICGRDVAGCRPNPLDVRGNLHGSVRRYLDGFLRWSRRSHRTTVFQLLRSCSADARFHDGCWRVALRLPRLEGSRLHPTRRSGWKA